MPRGAKRHPDTRIDNARTPNVNGNWRKFQGEYDLRFIYLFIFLFSDNIEKPINDFVRIAITVPDITCALKDGKFPSIPARITAVFHYTRAYTAIAGISYWRAYSVRRMRGSLVLDRKSVPRLEFFITLDRTYTASCTVLSRFQNRQRRRFSPRRHV